MFPTSVGVGYRIDAQAVGISPARDAWATSLVETPLMKLIFSTNEKNNFELSRYKQGKIHGI